MACKTVCKLCDRLIITTYATYDATSGKVVIGLPAGTYYDGQKYCIVLAQVVPANALVNAPVVFTVGTSTTQYPLTNCEGSPVTVCAIRSRTRYSTRLVTSTSGAVFRLIGNACRCGDVLPSISG